LSYDRSLIAAWLYVTRGGRLYELTYLSPKQEKRIKRWCEQLELETKGTERELTEPSLDKFKKKLTAELAERLAPRDFVLLSQPRLEETMKEKTDQQIADAIKRMIASYNL